MEPNYIFKKYQGLLEISDIYNQNWSNCNKELLQAKELLKEAHGILFSMAQMNVITHVAANQYYKDLKSYF